MRLRRGRAPHGRRASTGRADQPDRWKGAVSTDGETGIRPGGDNEPDRSASMRLGAERPRVAPGRFWLARRQSDRAAIFGAKFWAPQNNRSHTSAPSELYTTDHHNVADGLAGLPRDYAGGRDDITHEKNPLPPSTIEGGDGSEERQGHSLAAPGNRTTPHR
jgi:hypothetical protein